MKRNRPALDLRSVMVHLFLATLTLLILFPVIYTVSAAFRTNQAVYGPLFSTNTWVDRRIADKQAARIVEQAIFVKESGDVFFMILGNVFGKGTMRPQLNFYASCFSSRASFQSASAMMRTSSLKRTRGSQPRTSFAFE